MVKFSCSKDDKLVIGLGITEENIHKLKEGMPIFITPEEVKELTGGAVDANILIMYGKTADDIAVQLSPLISDKTRIKL
jgi:hypothetical protein